MVKKRFKISLLFLYFLGLIFLGGIVFLGIKKINFHPSYEVGQKIDSLNGVYVFYNGGVDNVEGRNLTVDGYNLGLKYQCVEWVKRYYYEHLDHSMPNSYGHDMSFFNTSLKDGQFNMDRNLIQFTNPSSKEPQVNDLIIFDGNKFNKYGHIAIISEVTRNEIEIIQQNVGATSTERFPLKFKNDKWLIVDSQVLGWLSMR